MTQIVFSINFKVLLYTIIHNEPKTEGERFKVTCQNVKILVTIPPVDSFVYLKLTRSRDLNPINHIISPGL